MPTYDYQCPKCEKVFEVFHSMSDDSDQTCPDCQAKAKKLIGGGSGIIFKGTGFYVTDYKNKKSESSAPPAAAPSKSE